MRHVENEGDRAVARMVAPEKLGTSACSLDSDLITVW